MNEFVATPRASTGAQGPRPPLAMESPIIITPIPAGLLVAKPFLPVPTSPPIQFGPLPIFPYLPMKAPGPPMKGAPPKKASQSVPPTKASKPPPGFEGVTPKPLHVIEGREDPFKWQ